MRLIYESVVDVRGVTVFRPLVWGGRQKRLVFLQFFTIVNTIN